MKKAELVLFIKSDYTENVSEVSNMFIENGYKMYVSSGKTPRFFGVDAEYMFKVSTIDDMSFENAENFIDMVEQTTSLFKQEDVYAIFLRVKNTVFNKKDYSAQTKVMELNLTDPEYRRACMEVEFEDNKEILGL